MLNKNIFL